MDANTSLLWCHSACDLLLLLLSGLAESDELSGPDAVVGESLSELLETIHGNSGRCDLDLTTSARRGEEEEGEE